MNVLEKMIGQEEAKVSELQLRQLLQNQQFLKTILAICLEIDNFISKMKLPFETILSKCEINAFDFWRVISNFA